MSGIESLVFFILVPVTTAITAWLVLLRFAVATRRKFPANGRSKSIAPIAVAGTVATAPAAVGIALWWMAAPIAETFYGPVQSSPAEAALFSTAAAAFAWAAAGSALSMALVFCARMRTVLGAGFGRVLPIAVIPWTGVVFALALNFLLLGMLKGEVDGSAHIDVTMIPAATAAFDAFAVAITAFPVAAWVSNRVKDLSGRGFARALAVMEVGELPVLVGLVQGILAIGALRMA